MNRSWSSKRSCLPISLLCLKNRLQDSLVETIFEIGNLKQPNWNSFKFYINTWKYKKDDQSECNKKRPCFSPLRTRNEAFQTQLPNRTSSYCYVCPQGRVYLKRMLIPYNWTTPELPEIDERISLTLLIFLTVIFNNNNNNNTYIAQISILLFSSRLHKAYMHKVHERTKKS